MYFNEFTNNSWAYQSLNFTPSTFDTFDTPFDSSLGFSTYSTYSSSPTAFSTETTYSPIIGYGLVDAAAAVAEAAGQGTFADVPPLGGNEWGADLIKAPEAWAHGYTGQNVVVAVLDTGVDYNQEDLANNIWTNPTPNDGDGFADDIHGWNFVDNNNDVMDDNGHGTHVAGIIAGESSNYGVTGIAYNAKIMPVKVLDSSGSGSYTTIAEGIDYAVDHGANIINLSLGGTSSNSTLESAIEYASSKGVTVVMAAGNDGAASPDYPASYASNYGIAVGAVDDTNTLASFSNRAGTQQINYVTAPGVDIYSTLPNNQFGTKSGTSMAAPYVTGLAALMLSANPNLTPTQLIQIITSTAQDTTQVPAPSSISDTQLAVPISVPSLPSLSSNPLQAILGNLSINITPDISSLDTQSALPVSLPSLASSGSNPFQGVVDNLLTITPDLSSLYNQSELPISVPTLASLGDNPFQGVVDNLLTITPNLSSLDTLPALPISLPTLASLDSNPFQGILGTLPTLAPNLSSLDTLPALPISLPTLASLDSNPFQGILGTLPTLAPNLSSLDTLPALPISLPTLASLGSNPFQGILGTLPTLAPNLSSLDIQPALPISLPSLPSLDSNPFQGILGNLPTLTPNLGSSNPLVNTVVQLLLSYYGSTPTNSPAGPP